MFKQAWQGALILAEIWWDCQGRSYILMSPEGEDKAYFEIQDGNGYIVGSFNCRFKMIETDHAIVDFAARNIEIVNGFGDYPRKNKLMKCLLESQITINLAGCIREDTDERQAQWISLIFEALQPWLKGFNQAVKPKITLPAKQYAGMGVGL